MNYREVAMQSGYLRLGRTRSLSVCLSEPDDLMSVVHSLTPIFMDGGLEDERSRPYS